MVSSFVVPSRKKKQESTSHFKATLNSDYNFCLEALEGL